jgi:hypothetical protein
MQRGSTAGQQQVESRHESIEESIGRRRRLRFAVRSRAVYVGRGRPVVLMRLLDVITRLLLVVCSYGFSLDSLQRQIFLANKLAADC